jgi:hypothetical protein
VEVDQEVDGEAVELSLVVAAGEQAGVVVVAEVLQQQRAVLGIGREDAGAL